MAQSPDEDYSGLQSSIKEFLCDWLNSLTPVEAKSKCMSISGVEYTPVEILEAVENETDLGKRLLNGLCEIQKRMVLNNPSYTVTDLIRKSIAFSTGASASASNS